MADSVFPVLRVGTLGFWILVVLAVLGIIPSPWDQWTLIAGAIIAFAHVVEIFIFRGFVAGYESKPKAILNIMLYGVFWILPTKANQ